MTDYREVQIGKLKNVQLIPRTRLTVDDVLDYGAEIVVIATGIALGGDGMNGPTHDTDRRARTHACPTC